MGWEDYWTNNLDIKLVGLWGRCPLYIKSGLVQYNSLKTYLHKLKNMEIIGKITTLHLKETIKYQTNGQ